MRPRQRDFPTDIPFGKCTAMQRHNAIMCIHHLSRPTRSRCASSSALVDAVLYCGMLSSVLCVCSTILTISGVSPAVLHTNIHISGWLTRCTHVRAWWYMCVFDWHRVFGVFIVASALSRIINVSSHFPFGAGSIRVRRLRPRTQNSAMMITM